MRKFDTWFMDDPLKSSVAHFSLYFLFFVDNKRFAPGDHHRHQMPPTGVGNRVDVTIFEVPKEGKISDNKERPISSSLSYCADRPIKSRTSESASLGHTPKGPCRLGGGTGVIDFDKTSF